MPERATQPIYHTTNAQTHVPGYWPTFESSQLWDLSDLYQQSWAMAQQSDNAGQSNAFYPTAQFPSAAPTASPAVTGQNYSYPPPQPDAQGNPPSDSNITHPSLSLPPIRNIDNAPQAQQQPGQQGAPAPSGPPMTMYYGQSQPLPDPNVPQRWPLPPDGRVMSGGRHKKEIKRRTKTGCLTCRKRRIKVRPSLSHNHTAHGNQR